jgi:hypothetical protein
LPGGSERIANLVAALQDPAGEQALLVFEFQSEHDPNKLDVTLEEVGILRCRARHGPDRQGKYRVLTAMVYLVGRCPDAVLDMTLSGGFGTRHAPLVWNVAEDNAPVVLEAVARGEMLWGMLFWVPLMANGQQPAVIARWRQVVTQVVAERRVRGDLAGIVMIFAELAGCRPAWQRGLEGFEMTESQVVKEWINQGRAQGNLERQRQDLLELLEGKFPGAVPNDVAQLIQQQDSQNLLHDWFKAAVRVATFEQFLAVLKK